MANTSKAKDVRKDFPVPCRFDLRTIKRLRKAAKKLGIPVSQVVRIAASQQLDEIERGAILIK